MKQRSRSILLVRFALAVVACAVARADTFEQALEKQFAKDEQLRRNDSPIQTFYVYKPKNEEEWIVAYWPEARMLLRFDNRSYNDPSWKGVVLFTKSLDLEKDLVATEAEIGSSTYITVAKEAIDDIRRCLAGRRVVVATPPEPDRGPLNMTVVRVKPHALKFDDIQFEYDYDIVELRVTSAGPLADQIVPVAIPRKGTALYENVVKSGPMRLCVESWEKLATPGRRLKVTADVKGYLKAKRENAPVAVLYASLSDVEPQ